MKTVAATIALLSLAVCLIVPVLFFAGQMERSAFEGVFLAGSLAWFVSATIWIVRAENAEELLE